MDSDLQLQKWTERQFTFGYSPAFIPFLVERLSATAPRIAELIGGASEDELSYKSSGKWSVKEHIGHLTDLEELHEGRLVDFSLQLDVLRPADMSNAKTEKARHNEALSPVLLDHFRTARRDFFKKLHSLDSATLNHRALHPRLQQSVNVADILYFMAEHDNHHLTHIAALLKAQ
jgi:uncharacterized damage-inducible protein DinB